MTTDSQQTNMANNEDLQNLPLAQPLLIRCQWYEKLA